MAPRSPGLRFWANIFWLGGVASLFALNSSRGLVSWLSLGVDCSSDLPVSLQVNNILQHTHLLFPVHGLLGGWTPDRGQHASPAPLCLPENNPLRKSKTAGAGKSDLAWLAGWNRQGYFFFFPLAVISTLLDHIAIFIVNLGTN